MVREVFSPMLSLEPLGQIHRCAFQKTYTALQDFEEHAEKLKEIVCTSQASLIFKV